MRAGWDVERGAVGQFELETQSLPATAVCTDLQRPPPSAALSSTSAGAAPQSSPAPHLLQRALLPSPHLCPCSSPPHPRIPWPPSCRALWNCQILPTFAPPPRKYLFLRESQPEGMGVQCEMGEKDRGHPLLSHQAVVHSGPRGPEFPGQLAGVCGGRRMCPEPPCPAPLGIPGSVVLQLQAAYFEDFPRSW